MPPRDPPDPRTHPAREFAPPAPLRTRAGLQWRPEAPGEITVIDPSTPRVHRLHGLESLVWEWSVQGDSQPRLAGRLRSLLNLSTADAESRLNSILQNWQAAGLLEADLPPPGSAPR